MHTSSKSKAFFIFIIVLVTSFNLNAGTPVRSKNGMVVSADAIATNVGVKILQSGGNAVDATVAVGFALAVTYPNAGNIGGGGFMVIHLENGKNTTIDFREMAPSAAYEKMFLDSLGNFNPSLSQEGWTSSGVPGTVAGLLYVLEKYGSMKLKDVIQPAIELASKGFLLTFRTAESINSCNADFKKYESSKIIFTNNGERLEENFLFVQKDLAKTLELIRDYGLNEFYNGSIAKRVVEESKKHGGIFTLDDFKNYKAIERNPVEGTYKNYKIISMAPPSSGGICLIETLNVLEYYSFKKDDWNSSNYIHTLVEILKHVYADRSEHLGDPDFYKVPTSQLLSKEYAKEIKNQINDNAVPSEKIYPANVYSYREKEETTHYSVADRFGNVVSTTYTLNGSFGNKIVVDGLGFLLNNEMDDFSAKPGIPNQFGLIGSKANSVQPQKRMLSSMTPTIVLKDDKPFLVVGSPGGSTIITSVLQVILNVLDFNMNIFDAINATRIHHQWLPDEIITEPFGISIDVKNNLISKGHTFGEQRKLGLVEGIMIDQKSKIFYGTSDPRGSGKAAGF